MLLVKGEIEERKDGSIDHILDKIVALGDGTSNVETEETQSDMWEKEAETVYKKWDSPFKERYTVDGWLDKANDYKKSNNISGYLAYASIAHAGYLKINQSSLLKTMPGKVQVDDTFLRALRMKIFDA